jgi:hypothetical protein
MIHLFYHLYGWVANPVYILLWMVRPWNHYWSGRLSTVDLLVLTSLVYLIISYFIINLCYNTSYPNEEVNCTEPFLSVSVPWLGLNINCLTCLLKRIGWESISNTMAFYINGLHHFCLSNCNIKPEQKKSFSNKTKWSEIEGRPKGWVQNTFFNSTIVCLRF